jgi:TonB-like protein
MRFTCVPLLLCLAASAQIREPESPIAIIGTVTSSDVKYVDLGRQAGRTYKGSIKVKVERTLSKIASAPPPQETILLRVDEQNNKPDWTVETGRSYVFLIDPLAAQEFKPLFAFTALAAAKTSGSFSSCFEQVDAARDSSGVFIWLDSPNVMRLVQKVVSMQIPGLMDGHMKGNVSLLLAVGASGDAQCVRVLKGHPLEFASAIEAIRQWRFRPYVVAGKPRSVVGEVTLEYDFHR